MGALLSCCLKAGYGELGVGAAVKPTRRRDNLKTLLGDRENPNVDGRKGSTPPPSMRERGREGSHRSKGRDKGRNRDKGHPDRNFDDEDVFKRPPSNRQLYGGEDPPASPSQIMNGRGSPDSSPSVKSVNFGTFASK